jgi:hypothetical protein
MLISVEGKGKKINWSQIRKVCGYSTVVILFFLRNPSPKPTGVLEHCREGETNC